MGIKRNNKGITLIALVVTIIVLLIILGITMSVLQSDSGVIKKTEEATQSKNKSEEKEAVEWAAAQTVGSSEIGKVEKDPLKGYLDSYIGEGKDNGFDYEVDDNYTGIFVVEFTTSGNKYTIDDNGNVYEGEQTNRDGIEIDPSYATIDVGETIKLTYITEADKEKIKWSSENEGIAKVDKDGNVTGIANGQVTITVTTDKGKKAECFIKVQTKPTGIELDPTEYVIDLSLADRTAQVNAKIIPETANVCTGITWTIDNEEVAQVNEFGLITGKANGEAIITATTENGISGVCKVIVQTSPIGINLNTNSAVLDRSGNHELQLEVVSYIPSTANVNTKITWTSSDESVATVDENGHVVGIKNGRAKITATTENGKTETCNIVVETSITEIKLSTNEELIDQGESITITANIKPDDGTATEDVIWTCSDTNVAKITTSGENNTIANIQALKLGVVTITAKNKKGTITDTAKIIIMPKVSNTNKEYSVKAYYEDYSYEDCWTEQTNCKNEQVKICEYYNCGQEKCTNVRRCDTVYMGQKCDKNGKNCRDVYEERNCKTSYECTSVCNSDCHYETRESCDSTEHCTTRWSTRLVSDSEKISFKLSSYVDAKKLKIVKTGLGNVSVGSISVSNKNNATYNVRITTSSTSFSTGELVLMYNDGDISQEIFRWTISCK